MILNTLILQLTPDPSNRLPPPSPITSLQTSPSWSSRRPKQTMKLARSQIKRWEVGTLCDMIGWEGGLLRMRPAVCVVGG